MMISTRGRYALRFLIDLAENQGEGYVPAKEIAARQGISTKYLEQILPALAKAGYLKGIAGKKGGYRLGMRPGECRVGDILRLTEGEFVPVACLAPGAEPCPREQGCRTIGMWRAFHQMAHDYFDSITLADLMQGEKGKGGC